MSETKKRGAWLGGRVMGRHRCTTPGCLWFARVELREPVLREGERLIRTRRLCEVHAVLYAARHLVGHERQKVYHLVLPNRVLDESRAEAVRLAEIEEGRAGEDGQASCTHEG